jgi:DNA polymerase I-like protein with 3'-5' exonuclease and polymerase domains
MYVTLGTFGCPFTPWRPQDGRVFERFAYDTETTEIDHERPDRTPAYVLGAACDGRRGVFISRPNLRAFFDAHDGAAIILHNAAFDLKVTAAVLSGVDVYRLVDAHRVWDTMILHRLLRLATAGDTGQGKSSLTNCAAEYLGLSLEKSQLNAAGDKIRTSFGQFLGRPPNEIPAAYLDYLARDALATWHLFDELFRRIRDVLRNSAGVWGYVNDAPDHVWGGTSDRWLRAVVGRFGPLTHHIQLKASILMDALTANGIAVDRRRRDEKAEKVRAVLQDCKDRLRLRGYLVDQKGSLKALQSILSEFHRGHPDVPLGRTASGDKWSTAEEDLAELAELDRFFRDYADYRHAQKLLSTYLGKMGPARVHPRFGILKVTGRTSCSGFNVQNLPNERGLLKADPAAATVRGCFVPGDGNVFIDCDYGQIELVVLGYALRHQFGLHSQLARLINDDHDVHRLIAATVLGKDAREVTKVERNSAKPVSFGRPGGMGVRGLRQVAKGNYNIDLTDDEVQQRIGAYHTLCPELDPFLTDEVDAGVVIPETLHLTPARYCDALGKYYDPFDAENQLPAGWLGGMLLKVLRDPEPRTDRGCGRPYSPDEISFFWDHAQDLAEKLEPKLAALLRNRRPGVQLWEAVRTWAGRRPVFTVTGRLRANATFCSGRNTVFQGAAADGAISGLWLVWRAGYKVVSFVHDQLVVESPADGKVRDRVEEIEKLMKDGMAMVVPAMRVKVETVVTTSLSKQDLDPRYDPATKELVREGAHSDWFLGGDGWVGESAVRPVGCEAALEQEGEARGPRRQGLPMGAGGVTAGPQTSG